MLARIMLAAVAALTFFSVPASAERRVALVIGNGAYKAATALPNTRNDAQAIAALLKAQQFEVISGVDLSKSAMSDKLLEFAKAASEADVALFFYAGHGIQVSGRNFLIPVDADLKSELHANLQAIDTDFVLNQTMGTAKVKLVLLDACRDNPFVGQIRRSMTTTRSVSVGAGLAEMKPGEGTLVAFATGPGQTALDGSEGGNSPFTRALLANITQPGVEIQQAMTKVRAQVNEETNKGQLPWGHTNLIGAVYLNGAPAPAAPGTAAAPSAAQIAAVQNSEVEVEFWRSIRDTNKPEELQAYLTNYPNGQFRSLALSRIASLEQGTANKPDATRNLSAGVDPAVFTEESSQLTEDKIGLDKGQRRDVQRRLNGLGFDTKVNGVFNQDTRNVIARWQAARGYPKSGYLNRLQHRALLSEIIATQPATASSDDEPKPAPRRRANSGGGNYQAPPQRHNSGPDPAAMGRFMGGVVGGVFR